MKIDRFPFKIDFFIFNLNSQIDFIHGPIRVSTPHPPKWPRDPISLKCDNCTLVFKILATTRKNLLPMNGQCDLNPTSGKALTTYFSIICSNWTDSDGNITTYEYMGRSKF